MMGTLFPHILDNGLNVLHTETDAFHLVSQIPTNYADVLTYSLAYKVLGAGVAFGPPATMVAPAGRTVVCPGFTDGEVTVSGTGVAWAAVTQGEERLDAVGIVDPISVLVVGAENPEAAPWSLPSFEISFGSESSDT